MEIIFATHNQYKVKEMKKIIPSNVSLLSLADINCMQEIQETGKTLEENAIIKANFVRYKYGLDCFSDDSGLEVDVLEGDPGVSSARYAGENKDNEANIKKLWDKLSGISKPRACFKTIFYVHLKGKCYLLKGKVNGTIIFEKRGVGGFGYDPIFIPDGFNKTFSELGDEIKNKISHRAKATQKLLKVFENH